MSYDEYLRLRIIYAGSAPSPHLPCGHFSERYDCQPRNLTEMAWIPGCHCVAAFQRAGANQKIVERDDNPPYSGFSPNSANQLGCSFRDRIDRHCELARKDAAPLTPLGSIRTVILSR